jgi:hypothetical protein
VFIEKTFRVPIETVRVRSPLRLSAKSGLRQNDILHKVLAADRDCWASHKKLSGLVETVRVSLMTARVFRYCQGSHNDSKGFLDTVRVPIRTFRVP